MHNARSAAEVAFECHHVVCAIPHPHAALSPALSSLCRHISNHMLSQTGSGELNPLLRLAAGAGAGIIAMSSTYPLDMVRGRLTVQEGRKAQYRGLIHATGCIIREEGFFALYKGWLPSVIGVVPYVGLNFAVYETLKAALLKHHGKKPHKRFTFCLVACFNWIYPPAPTGLVATIGMFH